MMSSGLTEVRNAFGPNRNRIAQAPLLPNSGQVTIDWDVPEPAVLLVVKMLDGQVAISRRVALAELKQRREPRAWEPSR